MPYATGRPHLPLPPSIPANPGEQLNATTAEISQRPRLPWLEYDDLAMGAGFEPERLPLSRVMSASASVPGIFPPVIVERNAQDLLIALADGGVVDNQGARRAPDRS